MISYLALAGQLFIFMKNPLFPTDDVNDSGYVLKRSNNPELQPPSASDSAKSAADLIRKKLDELYSEEPDTKEEIKEVKGEPPKERSKHQEFMYKLTTSGKSLAEIQTAWHNYYVDLPDKEKHEVWREFYRANGNNSHYSQFLKQVDRPAETSSTAVVTGQLEDHPAAIKKHQDNLAKKPRRKLSDRSKLLSKVSERRREQAAKHLRSMAFGLSMGVLVLGIFMFSFFNEIIIAPFIQPSRHVGSTPLIVSAAAVSPNSPPEVIIPKINVEIPVDYSLTSDNETEVETALEDGVIHYPSTVVPGQDGNASFFGHSSNNIFNPGKYKFAFVLLHNLVNGDTFYLVFQGKIYVYQVFNKVVVPPSDVGVLNDSYGRAATASLITCDPPGTSINRLVVTGVQISPDPSSNSTAAPTQVINSPSVLADNGPSLWSRLVHSVTSIF
ncbi:MAG TPA: sortase [Candidatus Saccharimonadales bacterium]|nr:sortase [Candidatus Saccharimonadales bacterium]